MTRADRRVPRAGLALALAVTLAACGAGGAIEPEPPRYASYAALGDSFTAAPFVPRTDYAAGCLRSSGNYPALVAEELGARLTDVSCSGAKTRDVLRPRTWPTRVPPQLEAVERGTDLVTVGIGGNDEDLFATLVGACSDAATTWGSCAPAVRDTLGPVDAVLARTSQRVARVLRAVQERAPEARVLLVGYLTLTSPDRGCADLPMTDTDRFFVNGVERRLDEALRAAAATTGAEYVAMRGRSADHDVCARRPWVNGATTDRERAMEYHPFAEGQRAVADAVLAALAEDAAP